MSHDFTYFWNLKNKINEHPKQKQTQTAHWWLPGGREVEGRAEVKGLSTDWLLQNGHESVKYSVGNIVSDIVITMYGVRWVLELGRSLSELCKCLTPMPYTCS